MDLMFHNLIVFFNRKNGNFTSVELIDAVYAHTDKFICVIYAYHIWS